MFGRKQTAPVEAVNDEAQETAEEKNGSEHTESTERSEKGEPKRSQEQEREQWKEETTKAIEKKLRAEFQAALAEYKHRESLNEKEREEYDRKQKDEEIERLKGQIRMNEITAYATQSLQQKGYRMSKDVLRMVIGQDEEETEANINALVRLVDGTVHERMKESARDIPKASTKQKKADLFDLAALARKNRLIGKE